MVEKILDWLKERLSQMAYGKMPTGKFDSRVVIEIKNESLLNDDWIEIQSQSHTELWTPKARN